VGEEDEDKGGWVEVEIEGSAGFGLEDVAFKLASFASLLWRILNKV
jgi:hypothetical protein